MMANLYPTALGAAFTQDPRISLMKFLKDNWGNGTILGLPAAATIKFDTKFGNLTLPNVVVVEKMPSQIQQTVLGASRNRHTDFYRVQIWCSGHSAINNKYLMEQEIERIIQTDPDGMLSDGVEIVLVDSFEDIPVDSDAKPSAFMAQSKPETIARSKSMIRLIYDKYVV